MSTDGNVDDILGLFKTIVTVFVGETNWKSFLKVPGGNKKETKEKNKLVKKFGNPLLVLL